MAEHADSSQTDIADKSEDSANKENQSVPPNESVLPNESDLPVEAVPKVLTEKEIADAIMNEKEGVFTTNDGRIFNIKLGIARGIGVINNMINDLGVDMNMGDGFPLSNVDGVLFEKVLEWLTEHAGAPPIVIETDPHTHERKWFTLTSWEMDFFNKYKTDTWALAEAANFLDVQSLYLYSCQKLAEMIKGKTPEAIREMFNLVDDLTPEEVADIRRNNPWCTY